MKSRSHTLAFLLPALAAAQAQYTGKVGGAEQKPVLRATAVYEYTGDLAKPNASRLVPVVVWDGSAYQPGGLYLARPEPLAVTPGTQYVLQKSGEPEGIFNISSAAKLTGGGWVGLGHFQPEAPPPPPAKLKPSKKLPALNGDKGKPDSTPDTNGPVLHKADPPPSSGDTGPTLHKREQGDTPSDDSGPTLHRKNTDASAEPDPQPDPDRPTLHRKDAGTGNASAQSAPDPDRPTLHRSDSASNSGQPDPDRPTLHRHADAAATVSTPDPDRPHLRYGASPEDESRGTPALLEAKPGTPATPKAALRVSDAVAVSDAGPDDPHPFAHAWPTLQAQTDAQTAMHALALRALATAAEATFGPAAKNDAALRQAAHAAQASFGPGTRAAARKRAATPPPADPLLEPKLTALELSYGGGATYVYTAHTAPEGPERRYVTVIAKPDFNGKPQVVFTQTTRGDQLAQTPALRLVDAVDANGDHKAELLFSLQTDATLANASAPRQFALYGINGNRADLLYTSDPAVQ